VPKKGVGMEYKHCDSLCAVRSREILPTLAESSNGIQMVIAYEFWCFVCEQKFYKRSDRIDFGFTNPRKVKTKELPAFIARLRMGKESSAVKSQKRWDGKVLAAMGWKQVS
jgi:hypothetical protein